jgi:hypothetical protein
MTRTRVKSSCSIKAFTRFDFLPPLEVNLFEIPAIFQRFLGLCLAPWSDAGEDLYFLFKLGNGESASVQRADERGVVGVGVVANVVADVAFESGKLHGDELPWSLVRFKFWAINRFPIWGAGVQFYKPFFANAV